MNDRNTLGAEIENFQLICTLRKAFVFSWKDILTRHKY